MNDVLLICYDDFQGDRPILTVGRKVQDNKIELVNVFKDEHATNLYDILTQVVKKEMKQND